MTLLRRILFLPPAASTLADAVDGLHAVVIGSTMLGTFAVFVATAYMLVRFRGGGRGPTMHIRPPLWAEVALIASILSLFLAFWVRGYLDYLRLRTAPADAMPVYVTAHQWMWEFTWPDGARSHDVLVVPVGQPVRLVMSSRDVIHSFYVPAFRVKEDVLPGSTTTAWFQATMTGAFPVFCAEYCGLDHSVMRGEVRVLDADAWAAWAASARPAGEVTQLGPPGAPSGLAAEGRAVAAAKGCLACHSVDTVPSSGPSWVGLWYATVPLSDGATVRADEPYLTRSMMDPEREVVAGYAPIMPSFRGRLTSAETAAILEFIRQLGGGPS